MLHEDKTKVIFKGKVQSATLVSISVDKLIVCILKSWEITALYIFLDFHASQEVKNQRKRSINFLDSSSSEKSLFVFVFRSKVRNSAELFHIELHSFLFVT